MTAVGANRGVLAAPLTRADVAALYRLVLSREPENEAVLQAAAGTPAMAFLRSILGSAEYRRLAVNRLTEEFLADLPQGEIQVAASEDELAALLDHARSTWAKFGAENPYWSVLTNDAFRGSRLESGELEASFFASGQGDVALFRAACARNGLALAADGTVLDFGCGVGRLGVHLAPMFGRYIGVDISAPHLQLAGDHLAAAGIANAELLQLSDFLDRSRPVDVDAFFSVIVLQHNPPPIICMLVRRLIASLRSGGVGYFQIPRALFDYSYSVAQHLARLGDGMEMHAVPQPAIFKLVADGGCDLIECLPDGRTGGAGLSSTYLVRKR